MALQRELRRISANLVDIIPGNPHPIRVIDTLEDMFIGPTPWNLLSPNETLPSFEEMGPYLQSLVCVIFMHKTNFDNTPSGLYELLRPRIENDDVWNLFCEILTYFGEI